MNLLILNIILLFFYSCSPQAPQPASLPVPIKEIGAVSKIKGTALINQQSLTLTSTLQEGDVIETGPKSFVQLKMNDQTIINLSAKTKIILKRYALNPEHREVNINLLIGKIKTHFRQKLIGPGSLQVTTKSTSFGVRGTEFITESSSLGKTKMILLEGKVVLAKKNEQEQIIKEIEVKPMEMVTIEESKPEAVIETKVISTEELSAVTNDEELNVNLENFKPEEIIEEPITETAPVIEQQVTEVLTNEKITNYLLSLEHSLKAFPSHSLNSALNKGEKNYRVPVIDENGSKSYVPVSEEFLSHLMTAKGNKVISVPPQSLDKAPERVPASLGL